jgi:hypothetical protein
LVTVHARLLSQVMVLITVSVRHGVSVLVMPFWCAPAIAVVDRYVMPVVSLKLFVLEEIVID